MVGSDNNRGKGSSMGSSRLQSGPESGLKKIPDFPISIQLEDNPLRKKHSRFLCNIRFKNDLPEVCVGGLLFLVYPAEFLFLEWCQSVLMTIRSMDGL